MDIAFDTTWCPVCSRQILPKRYYLPINPQPQAPVVPPSSPTSDPKADDDAPPARLPRTKTGTIRARGGGLVHGTGRVKPNGALKRNDTVKDSRKKAPDAPTGQVEPSLVRPAGPVRHRTVIDQSPVPLYCSDECRLADLQMSHGAIGIDYNPDRCMSPTLPPVPHNSLSDFSAPEESDSGSGASFDSQSSIASSPPAPQTRANPIPKGYAALARLFPDLPPPPPPAPIMRRDSGDSDVSINQDYQSGNMMAARRISAALSQGRPKKGSQFSAESKDSRPVPGWTDGSQAWRASVYNLTAPAELNKPIDEERAKDAYKGFAASSHRSQSGVYSTLSEAMPSFNTASSAASLPVHSPKTSASVARSQSAAEDLYSKYPLFARRSDSRSSIAGSPALGLSTSPTGSTRSLPVSTAPRRKEYSLVKPGAEGRLLVPDIKMSRVPSNLTVSSDASSSVGSYAGGYYGGSSRKRSPLSRQNSDASMESADSRATEEADETMRQWPSSPTSGTPSSKLPTRSWSYSDDTMTYPILRIPKKEKRVERRVIDGQERDVEVEVDVEEPRKCLFLFAGSR